MIDVKTTILSTIKDKIARLRFLGDYSPKDLKKLLYLIVLDDLYEWSNFLSDSQGVLKKIKDLRVLFILHNPFFIIEDEKRVVEGFIIKEQNPYINVNLNEDSTQWLRVWDSSHTKVTTCIPRDPFYDNMELVDFAEIKTLTDYKTEHNCCI